jgi:hypothetical protein
MPVPVIHTAAQFVVHVVVVVAAECACMLLVVMIAGLHRRISQMFQFWFEFADRRLLMRRELIAPQCSAN